jgi:hypothetical protein
MARLACIYGTRPPAPAGPEAENSLREAMLVLAHHLGAQRREADAALARGGPVRLGGVDVTAFEVGLVANQLLNRTPFPMSVFDRFERRWREIPTNTPAARRSSTSRRSTRPRPASRWTTSPWSPSRRGPGRSPKPGRSRRRATSTASRSRPARPPRPSR